MKPRIIAGLLGAGILFAGCETAVVEHDHYHAHGNGYRGDGPAVYVDSGDRGGYNRGYYHNDSSGDYRTQNVERTNVNVSETNVNRTVVNRTNVTQNVKQSAHPAAQPAPKPQTKVQKKGTGNAQAGHEKKKDGDQPQ